LTEYFIFPGILRLSSRNSGKYADKRVILTHSNKAWAGGTIDSNLNRVFPGVSITGEDESSGAVSVYQQLGDIGFESFGRSIDKRHVCIVIINSPALQGGVLNPPHE
jgi:hypothetical protein